MTPCAASARTIPASVAGCRKLIKTLPFGSRCTSDWLGGCTFRIAPASLNSADKSGSTVTPAA